MRLLYGYRLENGEVVLHKEEAKIVQLILDGPHHKVLKIISHLLPNKTYAAKVCLITRVRKNKEKYRQGKASAIHPPNYSIAIP